MSWSKFLDPLGLFKVKKEKPPAPEQINVTTADEGSSIPVLWGTRDIKSQQITYFGDVKTVAIKKKGGKKG